MSVSTDQKCNYQINDIELLDEEIEQFKCHYENLVFEGGGIRGIAFGGVVKFLEKYNLMCGIKRIAGSSAGAIVSAALAIGYTGNEITDLLDKTDFNKFKDDSWGVVVDIYRFVTQYGIYKGDMFLKWFQKVVKDKVGNENITFKEVYDQFGKELVITGTCLNRAKTYYFHHTTYPDMPIALAVRISMSIPLVFKAVTLKRREHKLDKDGNNVLDADGNLVTEEFDDIMVDGGLLNNYPIWVFDGKNIGDVHISEEKMKQSKTLGFKLMSDEEKQDYQLYHIDEKITDIVGYFSAFINSMSIQIERGHIRSGYWDNTVCVNTGNVHSLNFSLPKQTKDRLIKSGFDSVKNHFYCKIKDIPNQWNRILE